MLVHLVYISVYYEGMLANLTSFQRSTATRPSYKLTVARNPQSQALMFTAALESPSDGSMYARP